MCCFRFTCISLVTDLWGMAIRNYESFLTLIKTLMCILSSFWEPRVVVWFHFEPHNKAQSLKILRPACKLFSARKLGSNFCSLIFSVCAPIHLLTSSKEEPSPSIRSYYFIVPFCTITSHRDMLLLKEEMGALLNKVCCSIIQSYCLELYSETDRLYQMIVLLTLFQPNHVF